MQHLWSYVHTVPVHMHAVLNCSYTPSTPTARLQAEATRQLDATTEQELARLVVALRSLLISSGSNFHQLQDSITPADSALSAAGSRSRTPSMAGSTQSGAGGGDHSHANSSRRVSSAQQMQDLFDVVAAELARRSARVAEVSKQLAAAEGVVKQREEAVKTLEARLKWVVLYWVCVFVHSCTLCCVCERGEEGGLGTESMEGERLVLYSVHETPCSAPTPSSCTCVHVLQGPSRQDLCPGLSAQCAFRGGGRTTGRRVTCHCFCFVVLWLAPPCCCPSSCPLSIVV